MNTFRFKGIYIAVCLLSFGFSELLARQVPGYIVTLDKDTIAGRITLPVLNAYTGGIGLTNFYPEMLHAGILFKADGDKKSLQYLPGTIHAFGFRMRSTDYYFQSFIVKNKSLINSEDFRPLFLWMKYKGAYELYQYNANHDAQSDSPDYLESKADLITLIEFYIGFKGDIVRVGPDPKLEIRNLTDLLRYIGLKDEFLEEKNLKNYNFKHIHSVLRMYDHWLTDRQ